MDLMKQAGVGSVRIDAEWYFLEQTQGVYQATYMARMDHAIDGLKTRGIEPLIDVTSTPLWVSNAPNTDPDIPHEPPIRSHVDPTCDATKTICSTYDKSAQFNNFLSMLINRYAGKVSQYEIWNEPTGNWAWRRTETDWTQAATNVGTDYTTLLKGAYNTAKAIDPNITILGGSLSGTDGPNQVFLGSMYANGAKNFFDELSQHYYCDPPGHNFCNANRSIIDPETLADTFTANIVPIMNANSDSAKSVWVTETGYNTYTTGVTEAQQADFLTRTYAKAKTISQIKKLYWYTMDASDTGTNTENYYGLIAADTFNANALPANTRLKPAYNSYKQMTAMPVPGDVNSDGHVDITDLSLLLSNYNSTSGGVSDINNDGNVNIVDLSIMLSHYGT